MLFFSVVKPKLSFRNEKVQICRLSASRCRASEGIFGSSDLSGSPKGDRRKNFFTAPRCSYGGGGKAAIVSRYLSRGMFGRQRSESGNSLRQTMLLIVSSSLGKAPGSLRGFNADEANSG